MALGKLEIWKLREKALDRSVWRSGFGRSSVPVVRLTGCNLVTVPNIASRFRLF